MQRFSIGRIRTEKRLPLTDKEKKAAIHYFWTFEHKCRPLVPHDKDDKMSSYFRFTTIRHKQQVGNCHWTGLGWPVPPARPALLFRYRAASISRVVTLNTICDIAQPTAAAAVAASWVETFSQTRWLSCSHTIILVGKQGFLTSSQPQCQLSCN